MKVLIVDDDKLILEAIAHNLMSDGYEVVRAENGYEALDMIDKMKIDLIISDVMMPNISGLGLLSLLKQFYFNKIPVIIISSLDKADVVLHSIGLGAVDFISKPIDFTQLMPMIRKYTIK
ncbi:MAG TPA: response regulator [Bacteroidia bacterium]|jgi:DNA-binding response OmpR family regulator